MENPFAMVYRWVGAHQDDIKNWEDPSLNERLNVIVNGLAKNVLVAGVVEQECYCSCCFMKVRLIK